MEVMFEICKFCNKLAARKVQNSVPGQITLFCSYCRHTYTVIGEDMGKRKKKKNKATTSAAVKNQVTINKTTVNDPNDSWEVEIDCVESCSKAPDTINIWFLPLAKRKVDALMKEYTNIEWLAYLLGEKDGREIVDIFIPDQSISAAKVDDIECDEYNDLSVIGVIHSHHTMGNTFSQTDHDWINQNHNISLCISTTGIAGQYRYKTACGAFKIIDVNAKLRVNLDFNDEEFIESVKDKLIKKTYTSYGYGAGYVGGVGGRSWSEQNPWAGHDSLNGFLTSEETDETDTEDDSLNGFLTSEERAELEIEIEELDFTKELSLAEELELMDEMNSQENKEDN
jgi:uncharacterized Zn finger protein (UPF0148 family)